MRLRLSKNTRAKLPITDDQVPLKTAENLEEYLQSARLEFSGLTAWLNSEDCYLRKLGANAIELQPVHQFDSRSKEEYHWGYMPINYFSPAAEYASCPSRAGHEFHGLVESFHQAGMAVILDVVYNHMGIPNHLLNLDRELYL